MYGSIFGLIVGFPHDLVDKTPRVLLEETTANFPCARGVWDGDCLECVCEGFVVGSMIIYRSLLVDLNPIVWHAIVYYK